jgi:hypothetical protein
MRTLIKKILFEEFYSNKIYVEEITQTELNRLMILNEGTPKIKCNSSFFNQGKDRIKTYYDELKSYKYRRSRFLVYQTDHYCSRYERKDEPENENRTDIHNPFINEGIDLIFKGIPLIYDKIVNNNWENKKELCFTLKTDSITKDGEIVPYTIAFVVNKKLFDTRTYKITLKTHIKGDELRDKNYEYCGKYTI